MRQHLKISINFLTFISLTFHYVEYFSSHKSDARPKYYIEWKLMDVTVKQNFHELIP